MLDNEILDMNLEAVKKEVMQLMVLIAQNKKEEAKELAESVLEMINEGLDFAATDEDLVQWGKLEKIVNELKGKIA